MKGCFILGTKKGSIVYGIMILILCSSLLVRQNRLMTSHLYLQRGVYSMDIRIDSFSQEMIQVEEDLNLRFESFEAFKAHMDKGYKVIVSPFEITRDSMYNEFNVFMLKVKDQKSNHIRWVMVINVDEKITLNVRGV